jgi:hypothetical protein
MRSLSWRLTLRVIAVLSWIVAIAWLIVDPGFEPLLAFLTGAAAFLGSFVARERGLTSESLLRQLAQRVNMHELIKCIKPGTAYVHDWVARSFTYYPPIRGIIDIVIEAINDNNRLLAANGLEILVSLAERICGDDENIAKELHNLNKMREYRLRIASKIASPRLFCKIRWKESGDIRPIFVIWYFSSLFFGLYDLVKDQNDLALLCIKGIEASLQNNIYEVGEWWWEEIEAIILFAVKNNHPTHIEEIANLFYKYPSLSHFSRRDLRSEEIQEFFHSSRIDGCTLGYLERIIRTIIDGGIDPRPLGQMIQFALLTATLSILHEETGTGGLAADALILFSKSVIEIENTSWPDKENIFPDNVVNTCVHDFEQAATFIVWQVYKSGFAESNDWWESFTRYYLIHSCVRPLGNYLFAEEWGNLLPSLLSTARYITEVEILAGGKLRKFTNHNKNSSDTIANMFKEWFEHCPSYSAGEREWRNNADLVVKTICRSADTIRHHNQQAFLTYCRSLEEAFESTYVWPEMSKCLQ